MSVELSSLSFGQLLALDAVLDAAIAAGARMEAAGLAFEASVDLGEEVATVAFSCPCPCPGSVEVVGWDLAATPMRTAVLALPAPDGREDA